MNVPRFGWTSLYYLDIKRQILLLQTGNSDDRFLKLLAQTVHTGIKVKAEAEKNFVRDHYSLVNFLFLPFRY